MFPTISRRNFLAGTAAMGGAAMLPSLPATAAVPLSLQVARRVIDVNGKAGNVFGIRNAAGGAGAILGPDQRFAVLLENRSGDETIVHWHGQTPPAAHDGVTETGYASPIADGAAQPYDFAPRPGTHWMHSHHGLQQQNLLAAPLIVRTAADLSADRQEVVVMLHDFSFKDPAEILASLGGMASMPGMAGHAMPPGMTMPGMGHADLNDVEYDAYLANDRTLSDPEVIATEANGKVLLRIINATASTNLWIDLGTNRGQILAIDGNPVKPLSGSRFPLAIAQRIDLLVTVPGGAAIPVLAQREGDQARTGIVLAAPRATLTKIAPSAAKAAEALDMSIVSRLSAMNPLPARAADITQRIALTGAMMPYVWSINDRIWTNHQPIKVTAGKRVALEMENRTGMAHPMHLHGHHFQVIALNGSPVSGPMLDTVLVTPMSRVTVAFEADNPGRWLFHCHHLYHMASGMMTELVYA